MPRAGPRGQGGAPELGAACLGSEAPPVGGGASNLLLHRTSLLPSFRPSSAASGIHAVVWPSLPLSPGIFISPNRSSVPPKHSLPAPLPQPPVPTTHFLSVTLTPPGTSRSGVRQHLSSLWPAVSRQHHVHGGPPRGSPSQNPSLFQAESHSSVWTDRSGPSSLRGRTCWLPPRHVVALTPGRESNHTVLKSLSGGCVPRSQASRGSHSGSLPLAWSTHPRRLRLPPPAQSDAVWSWGLDAEESRTEKKCPFS